MKRDLDFSRQLLFDIEATGHDCSLTQLRTNSVPGIAAPEASERVRYHLRLLIDAGLVKEVDRTNAGVPCVRLTNAGHELVELARSDSRWDEAKRYTLNATGGLSLTVVRAVLTKWAVEGAAVAVRRYSDLPYSDSPYTEHAPYSRRYAATYSTPRRGYRPYYHRVEPRRRYGDYRIEYREPVVRYATYQDSVVRDAALRESVNRDLQAEATSRQEELRLVRTRPDYRERYDSLCGHDRDYARPLNDRYDYPYSTDEVYASDAGETGLGVSLPIYLV